MRMQPLAALAALLAIAGTAAAQKPASIDVPARVTLVAGSDTSVIAVVKDGTGKAIPGASVQYSSSDTSIVQVTMLGSLKGVSPGSARITATAIGPDGDRSPAVTATIAVTVRTDVGPVLGQTAARKSDRDRVP